MATSKTVKELNCELADTLVEEGRTDPNSVYAGMLRKSAVFASLSCSPAYQIADRDVNHACWRRSAARAFSLKMAMTSNSSTYLSYSARSSTERLPWLAFSASWSSRD
jgi:hypothetical protein